MENYVFFICQKRIFIDRLQEWGNCFWPSRPILLENQLLHCLNEKWKKTKSSSLKGIAEFLNVLEVIF